MTATLEERRRHSPRAALRQTFRALRNWNYRMFWLGQVVSTIGTWMQRIGLAWYVLDKTDSAFALGLVTMFQTLPVLLLALIGGVIADRFPKRDLLFWTQGTLMLQSAGLAVLTAIGTSNLIPIYVLATIQGIAKAIDNPTRQAFVKELVGPNDVPNAVALNSIVFNSARLIGPALGGGVIALVGVPGCFTIDAISFLGVLIGLFLMKPEKFYDIAGPQRGRMLGQISEGIRYAVRTPEIAVVLLLMLVVGTFGYNFTVLLPLIAEYVLDTGPVGFGVLTSTMAVGSLTAAVGIAYTGRVSQKTLLVGASGFTALLFCLSLTTTWATTILILAPLGLFSIVFTATANSRLQIITPPELRGRIMSLYTLMFLGSTPIGSLIIGSLAEHQGVRMATAEVAGLCAVGIGLTFGYLYLHRPEQDESRALEQQVVREHTVR
ncbi:MAG TPA: MFS transporter [Thermomicrobiales bacterium]|nr:MFS transporter [Thermomicrobiales bacterium]